jgi:hypothetical protein
MIDASQISAELLKACPEFKQTWDEYVSWMVNVEKPRTDGTDALVIAAFLGESYKSHQTHFFPRFFATVERLLTDGEPDTGAVVYQILKQMGMSSVARMQGPEIYAVWMGAETRRLWDQVYQEVLSKRASVAGKPRRKVRP